jgi:putative hydrolase of the HAD superfamily
MLKILLLDADGVLINGGSFSTHLEREYGIPRKRTQPFFLVPFKDCILGNTDLKEALAPHLPEWGWDKGVDAMLKFWFEAEHVIDEPLVAYAQQLRNKGVRCYVATNQERHRAAYMLNEMGFAKSFDGLFASAHLGHKKPDLTFYAKVMESLPGIAKEEVVFWDDTEQSVVAAREFGWKAETYTGFEEFEEKMKACIS